MTKKIRLTENHHGKSAVRLLRVDRSETPHRLLEAEVDIRVEGQRKEAFSAGDNSSVLPTDTMKNTVYALAREQAPETIEALGQVLAEHLVSEHEMVTRAAVEVEERIWSPIGPRPDAFERVGSERATTRVVVDGGGRRVRSGLTGLTLLKTAHSGFSGFPRDRYTTLVETDDRLLATRITAAWSYRGEELDYGVARAEVRRILVDTFAGHDSLSVQHTLYAMGQAVLEGVEEVWKIRLNLPNKHYHLADLAPFGLDNPNQVFVPTDEPFGNIEATLERT
ncbi:MAG: urate oxidase [Holophagales bacterium]|nr:urate oxidase [Holophagales bacterium]